MDERSGPVDRPTGPGREVVLSPGRRPAGTPRREPDRDHGSRPDWGADPVSDTGSHRGDRLPELAAGRRDLVPVRSAPLRRLDPVEDVDGDVDYDDELDRDGPADQRRSFGQAWASFVGQILAAAAGGLVVWLGFQSLWRRWPYGAAGAAAGVLVILLLGGHLVHRRRHPDEPPDMVTVGILVIVGLVLTISPAAFVLRPI